MLNATQKITPLVKLLFALMLLNLPNTQAQTKLDYDTNYIESYIDKFVVRVYNSLNTASIDYAYGDKSISYTSSRPDAYGIGIDYKWITFEYAGQLPFSSGSADGIQTKMQRTGVGLTMRKLWFWGLMENIEGYYLDNTNDWFENYNLNNRSYYYRHDIKVGNYALSVNYGFNHKKYTNMGALWQLERQKKSAGSFTMGFTFALNRCHADSGIVPDLSLNNNNINLPQNFELYSYGLNVGYLHAFAFGKRRQWQLTLAFIPSFALQYGESQNESGEKIKFERLFGLMSESRIGLSYQGKRWFGGLSNRNINVSNFINDENPIDVNTDEQRFYVGYRFDMPQTNNKYLKKLGL